MKFDYEDVDPMTNSFDLPFIGFLADEESYFETLNFEQKKEYLILNEIFCPVNKDIKFVYKNLLYPHNILESSCDIENNILMDNRFIFRGVIYSLNILVIKDVYRIIEDYVTGTLEEILEDEINKNTIILENFIDSEEKKKYILNNYNLHFNNLKEDDNLIYFKFTDDDLDWKLFIEGKINKQMSFVVKHLSNSKYYDVSDYEISKSWLNLEYSTKMMSFFKSYLNENSNLQLSSTATKLSIRQKILLIEKLIVSEPWGEFPDRKKGEILSLILERNSTNIRNVLAKSNKKSSENTKEFNADVLTVTNILKSLE